MSFEIQTDSLAMGVIGSTVKILGDLNILYIIQAIRSGLGAKEFIFVASNHVIYI